MEYEEYEQKRPRGRPQNEEPSHQFHVSVAASKVQRMTLYSQALGHTPVGELIRDAIEEWMMRHGPQLDLLLDQDRELRRRASAMKLLASAGAEKRIQRQAKQRYNEQKHILTSFSNQFREQMRQRRGRKLPPLPFEE